MVCCDVVVKQHENRQFWAAWGPQILDDHFHIWLTAEHAVQSLVEFRGVTWEDSRIKKTKRLAKCNGLTSIRVGGCDSECP